jgi:hypothetical protein
VYSLWGSATKSEGGEYELDPLVWPCQERVDALPRLAVRVNQVRRVEGAILRPVRDAYEPLVALCRGGEYFIKPGQVDSGADQGPIPATF